MAKVLAISGSHGVGKTSLLSKIDDYCRGEEVKILKEINTGLFNIGLALNGLSYDFDETIFCQKKAFDLGYDVFNYYLNKEEDKRLIITDRSCIDTYIYTLFFIKGNPNYKEKYHSILKEMEEKSLELLERLYHILLPPFKESFDKNKDRMDLKSQEGVWQEFLDFFDNQGTRYTILSSENTNDRLLEIKKFLV